MHIETALYCESWRKGATYFIPDWHALLNIQLLVTIVRLQRAPRLIELIKI